MIAILPLDCLSVAYGRYLHLVRTDRVMGLNEALNHPPVAGQQSPGARMSRCHSFVISNRRLVAGKNRQRCGKSAHPADRWPCSLARPAPLGKHRTAGVDRTPQQARALERLIAFRTRRQQACPLQRICREDILIDVVWRPLRFFHHRFASCATQSEKDRQKTTGLTWTHRTAAIFPSPDAFMT